MTMSTLAEICAAIQDVVGAVDGIRYAPDTPPEGKNITSPTAFCYPMSGEVHEETEGRGQANHTIQLSVITAKSNWRTDWDRIIGFGDTVPAALLADQTLGGVVMGTAPIRYTFGEVIWADLSGIGWQFEIDVMVMGSLD